MDESAAAEFMSITSSERHVAEGFLEMTGGDVMQAIQLYFDNPDLQSSFNTVQPSGSGSASTARNAAGAGLGTSSSRALRIDEDYDEDHDGDDDVGYGRPAVPRAPLPFYSSRAEAADRRSRRGPQPQQPGGRGQQDAIDLDDSEEEDDAVMHGVAGSRSAAASRVSATARPQYRVADDEYDDDDDIVIPDSDAEIEIPDEDESDDAAVAASVARNAQEEEDAAMAQRLQEELYRESGGGGSRGGGPEGAGGPGGLGADLLDEDGYRAPMGRTTETLIGPGSTGPPGGLAATAAQLGIPWGTMPAGIQQEEMDALFEQFGGPRRSRPAVRSRAQPNPFAQSIWEDDSDRPPQIPPISDLTANSPDAGGSTAGAQTRAQRLADMFRPPYEMMSPLEWDDARQEGKEDKKWLLINLQDMSNFSCQALNRDHWKDPSILAIIQEFFIFLQYDKDTHRSREYINLYLPGHQHENQDIFPHVAIVDPRTGEQVKVWSGLPFPTVGEFHSQLVEFLDRYSLESNSKNPVVKSKPKHPRVDINRMSEEEMLRLAVENSLASANGGGGGGSGASSGSGASAGAAAGSSSRNAYDPDELTRAASAGPGIDLARHYAAAGLSEGGVIDLTGADSTPPDAGTPGAYTASGALPAPEDPEPAAAADQPPSLFATVASDRPHEQPTGTDAATTTRIQFRHREGRVIRRFNLTDTVRRVYEWLKADPLEGKQGVEFELKTSPQGVDLLDSLDKSIAEAGLKNGTVMIEFLDS